MSIIVNLDTINAKSIDLIFDVGDLLSTDIINITGLVSPTISTIFNETYTSATLLFDTILTFGESYEVTIERDGAIISTLNFDYNKIVSIETAELICNGTNSFTLNFKYPVNLPASNILPTANDTISPFLFLASNKALGLPNIPATLTNDFHWESSTDLKSINIESHDYPFNIGNVSIFTNYPSLFDAVKPTIWVTEFDEADRKIPPILSEGIIDSVSKEPTTVCSFTQYNGSKHFFIAEFCDNILFMENDITLIIDGGAPIVGTRTPYNSPSTVLFDASIDLIPGVYSISIPSIYDANMNKTIAYEGLLVINDVDPIVESAEAINANEVRLIYNTIMNEISDTSDPDFPKSALKALNYTLISLDGLLYDGEVLDVKSETLTGDTRTSVILELSKPLSFGNYEVTVDNVVSSAGTSLVSNKANFLFKDTKEPDVKIIAYGKPDATPKIVFDATNQKVIVKYDKAMNIIPAENSADDNANFGIKYTGVDLTLFDPLTEIVNISKAYQNRFRLPLTTELDLLGKESDELKLLVGYNNYVEGENIQKRVSSTSGSHVKITETGRNIDLFAWPMAFCDSDFAKMSLVLPNQILYSYNETGNNNEFYKIAYENMTFTLTGGIPVDEPLVIDVTQEPKIVNDGKSILFTFVGDINQDATDIRVTQLADGDIKDFFDGAVTMTGNSCTLKLDRDMVQPIVKAASIVSLDSSKPTTSNPVKVALLFNKQMKYTSDDNFIITDSSLRELQVPTSRILFGSANPDAVPEDVFNANYGYLPASSDLTIIEVCGELNRNVNSSNALLSVASNLDPQQMDTEDIHSNVVKPFEMPIANIKSKSFSIKTIENGGSMDAEFRLSLFEEINTDWFNEFKFGEKDTNGKYTLNAELKASYIDTGNVSKDLANGNAVPANKLVTQTFELSKTITPLESTGSFDQNDIPSTVQKIGGLIALKDASDNITGEVCVMTAVDTTNLPRIDYVGRIIAGEIVTKSYAGGTIPTLGGNRVTNVPANTVDVITNVNTADEEYTAVRVTTEEFTCSADSNPIPAVDSLFENIHSDYKSYFDFVTEIITPPVNPGTEGKYRAYRSSSIAAGTLSKTVCPLGTITVKYYSARSNTPTLTIDLDDKTAEVYFTDDLKALIVNIKQIATEDYMKEITITTNYLIPAPYVLMTRNNMNFVNTSFKAIHSNNNNPIS